MEFCSASYWSHLEWSACSLYMNLPRDMSAPMADCGGYHRVCVSKNNYSKLETSQQIYLMITFFIIIIIYFFVIFTLPLCTYTYIVYIFSHASHYLNCKIDSLLRNT